MNVNFFHWIRDGVKQSVLLGVSDAIETLGTPADTKAMHPSILAMMDNTPNPGSGQHVASREHVVGHESRTKKRLGRSLKDINPKPAEGLSNTH